MGGPTSSRRLLLAGALLASALFASRAYAYAGYCGPRHEPPRRPLKSVALNLPFYFFDRAGRFYRGNFGDETHRLISDHGLLTRFRVYTSRSPDGRWIAYSGRVEPDEASQYWLYDKQSGTDRLLLQTPKRTWIDERFSPDGKQTAIMVISPVPIRGWEPRNATLQLIDNASGRSRAVRLPGDITMLKQIPVPWASKGQGYEIFWSRDGDQVLTYFRSDSYNGGTQEYYRVRLATRTPERIGGRYDGARSRPVFLDGTRRIPIDDRRTPLRSDSTYFELRSPDAAWTAFMGFDPRKHVIGLYVRGRDGTTRELYRGSGDICDHAYVIAWLDSRYVLYRNLRWSTYVGDARTGRSKELFPDFDAPRLFDW